MKKIEKIILPFGAGCKLAKVFGVSVGTVSNALAGRRTSDLSNRIRHVALTEYGGRILPDDDWPT